MGAKFFLLLLCYGTATASISSLGLLRAAEIHSAQQKDVSNFHATSNPYKMLC